MAARDQQIIRRRRRGDIATIDGQLDLKVEELHGGQRVTGSIELRWLLVPNAILPELPPDDDDPGRPPPPPPPPTKPPAMFTKREFIKGFVPPDYLIDGILQKRFIYSLTGQTGHAKTALALLIAELVSSAVQAALGGHDVVKGTVIYLVGENPDDVRMRVIGANSRRTDDNALDDRIIFVPGIFSIPEMRAHVAKRAEEIGGVDLIIVDTSAAYFLGREELNNVEMGAHARMLRSELTTIPGSPCVIVLCHPIKYVTDPSQLLPRGGGAFMAEMDGNLTLWKRSDGLFELSHSGKFRGPGFEPVVFKLEKITTSALVDTKGRPIPTVRIVPVSEQEEERQSLLARDDQDRLLFALRENADRSIAELARACDWALQTGEPHKSKVHRLLEQLEKVRPKLVSKERGGSRQAR
jgi:hypothetical protein